MGFCFFLGAQSRLLFFSESERGSYGAFYSMRGRQRRTGNVRAKSPALVSARILEGGCILCFQISRGVATTAIYSSTEAQQITSYVPYVHRSFSGAYV